ncbi:MAG: hypothetical protein R6X17_04475 [Candidatus Competibacteraceae bacterium]
MTVDTLPHRRRSRKAPATFKPALDRGETAPFPCWPIRYGLVLHHEVPQGNPPWRTDQEDGWAISDGVTGYRLIAFRQTPRAALQELHRRLRAEQNRSGRSYTAIVNDARRRAIHGEGVD